MSSRRPRILVVDDEPQVLELVRHILDGQGYAVSLAASGPEALKAMGAQPPDLVLLDLMMPGMSGQEVCRRLKADPRTAPIPVIILTGKKAEEDAVEGFRLGAADFIRKPFGMRELAARVAARLPGPEPGLHRPASRTP